MRSLIIFYIFFFPNPNGWSGSNKSDVKKSYDVKDFIDKTGIKPGMYVLSSGPDKCLRDELKIIENKDHFTLSLGDHALVLGLGSGGYETKNKDCKVKVVSSYGPNLATSTRTEICPDDSLENTVTITKTEIGFNYELKTTASSKSVTTDKCQLEYVDPIEPKKKIKK